MIKTGARNGHTSYLKMQMQTIVFIYLFIYLFLFIFIFFIANRVVISVVKVR